MMANTEQTAINLEKKSTTENLFVLDDPVNPKLPLIDTIPINNQTNSEPVPVDNVIVDDSINLKPSITSKSPLADLNTKAAITAGICRSTTSLIFLGIITIIPSE